MLKELQKNLTSIDSFKKDVSLLSGTMREEINVAYKVIVRLILTWPSSKCQPGILETSPPYLLLGILETSPHISRIHIFRSPRMARPPTRKSEKNKIAELLKTRARLERLHPSHWYPCPQRSQYGLQGPESFHPLQQ